MHCHICQVLFKSYILQWVSFIKFLLLTHQHGNGVEEWQNHHMLDVARSIMIHMHVPKLWSDVLLTAYYLINHVTSPVLTGQNSFYVLFKDKKLWLVYLDYLDSYILFVLEKRHEKLDSRAVKCIFRLLVYLEEISSLQFNY